MDDKKFYDMHVILHGTDAELIPEIQEVENDSVSQITRNALRLYRDVMTGAVTINREKTKEQQQ